MEEPEVIHSQRKHEVSIPEGSHVAVSKTATPQEPSVRKVLRTGGGEESEHKPEDRFAQNEEHQGASRTVSHADEVQPERTDLAKKPLHSSDDRLRSDAPATPPQRVANQAPVRPADAPPLNSEVNPAIPAQVLVQKVDSSNDQPEFSAQEMPQMDFPARVVHLRIENEKLRTRLENLDS